MNKLLTLVKLHGWRSLCGRLRVLTDTFITPSQLDTFTSDRYDATPETPSC